MPFHKRNSRRAQTNAAAAGTFCVRVLRTVLTETALHQLVEIALFRGLCRIRFDEILGLLFQRLVETEDIVRRDDGSTLHQDV